MVRIVFRVVVILVTNRSNTRNSSSMNTPIMENDMGHEMENEPETGGYMSINIMVQFFSST